MCQSCNFTLIYMIFLIGACLPTSSSAAREQEYCLLPGYLVGTQKTVIERTTINERRISYFLENTVSSRGRPRFPACA